MAEYKTLTRTALVHRNGVEITLVKGTSISTDSVHYHELNSSGLFGDPLAQPDSAPVSNLLVAIRRHTAGTRGFTDGVEYEWKNAGDVVNVDPTYVDDMLADSDYEVV